MPEYFFECSGFPHVALGSSSANSHSNVPAQLSVYIVIHLVCSSVDFKILCPPCVYTVHVMSNNKKYIRISAWKCVGGTY